MLDALEQALYDRKPFGGDRLIHHGDRELQYGGIRYTKRLAEAGREPSGGSLGDSYHNALAEWFINLYKAELIPRRTSWPLYDDVEWAALNLVIGLTAADCWNSSATSRRQKQKPPTIHELTIAT